VLGNISESTENLEPALWEKLLETDVKQTINQETYQELGNAGTSPVNPFIHEYRLSNKVEPQIFSIEGGHAQTFEQLNNGSIGDKLIWNADRYFFVCLFLYEIILTVRLINLLSPPAKDDVVVVFCMFVLI
jgi:hypothetical protein